MDTAELARILSRALAPTSPSREYESADDAVTTLPMGATARNLWGYDTEAEYLAAYRPRTTMRIHQGARRKARFDSMPPRDGSIAARERMAGDVLRQRRSEVMSAAIVWGCPNLIVGP